MSAPNAVDSSRLKSPVKPVPHEPLAIAEVILVRPPRFGDERGYFTETYHADKWAAAGIGVTFVQDNQSLSAEVGTIRGLHYQLAPYAQGKLVRVLQGRVLDVAVDIRRSSPTFGQHVSAELTADGGEQIFVPPGFAHGFATLEPDTIVAYKVSGVYSPESERGIRFDDPDLGIDWKVDTSKATLSKKDTGNPKLADQPDLFA